MKNELLITEIGRKIYRIRGRQVILDYDLAELYHVETRVLNQAVKRNPKRFPSEDFFFQINRKEFELLLSQVDNLENGRLGQRKYLSVAFTEHGVAMLSCILNSDRAIQVNIATVNFFVLFRRVLRNEHELNEKLESLQGKLGTVEAKIDQLIPHQILSTSDRQVNVTPFFTRQDSRVEIILDLVAKEFCLRPEALSRATRLKDFVRPRQIAMYLIRKNTALGYREIGKYFGGKDHSTVLHACRKIGETAMRDRVIFKVIETLERAIDQEIVKKF
ncbi:MAG: ORF6N domain-containing protein [Bdellovibrionia bacterium]